MDKIRAGKEATCIALSPLKLTVGKKYLVESITGTGHLRIKNDVGNWIPAPIRYFRMERVS